MNGEFFDRIDIRHEDFITGRVRLFALFRRSRGNRTVETNDGVMKDEKTMKSGQ
jgi:hypothetical protein